MKESIKARLSKGRFEHTERVVQTALEIAALYRGDSEKTEQAAWLHDIAKEHKASKLLEIASGQGLGIDDFERANPHLLHAKVGAFIAESEFGVTNLDTLQAIRTHTLGHPEMDLFGEIIFLADAMEPNRPDAGDIRAVFQEEGLRRAICFCCQQSISWLLSKNMLIHPCTIDTYNHYLIDNS